MIPAKDLLHDILYNGIAVDIFQAEESLFLTELFSKNSNELYKNSFSNLFSKLNYLFIKELTLAITKLYEKKKSYNIRSIPSALQLLEKNADNLKIQERPFVIKKLVRCGFGGINLNDLNDAQITGEIVKYFDTCNISADMRKALNALKTARDKVIAHPEAIDISGLPKTTFDEIKRLIAYAKEFLGIVGIGYLSIAYEDDEGNHFLSSDVKRTTQAMERLLIKADILSNHITKTR